MKKLCISIFTIFFLFSAHCTYFADDGPISVVFDEKAIQFDQPPIMQDSRVLVPVRAIFEALGAKVEWIDTGHILAQKNDVLIILQIGNNTMLKTVSNKGFKIILDVPPTLINNRTLVPVRAVSEAFDCIVHWDSMADTVFVSSIEVQNTDGADDPDSKITEHKEDTDLFPNDTNENTIFYNDYPTVPDFGSLNSDIKFLRKVTVDGGAGYAYDATSVSASDCDEYFSALKRNGFKYVDYPFSPNGNQDFNIANTVLYQKANIIVGIVIDPDIVVIGIGIMSQ